MGGCCRIVCTAVACGALFLALLTVGDVANPKSPTWTQWGWVWHLVTAGWGVAAATEAADELHPLLGQRSSRERTISVRAVPSKHVKPFPPPPRIPTSSFPHFHDSDSDNDNTNKTDNGSVQYAATPIPRPRPRLRPRPLPPLPTPAPPETTTPTTVTVPVDIAFCNRCSFERDALTLRAALERHLWLRLRAAEACFHRVEVEDGDVADGGVPGLIEVRVSLTLTPKRLPAIASWVLSLSHAAQLAAGMAVVLGETTVSMLGLRRDSFVADVVDSRTSLVAASLALSGFSARLVRAHGPLDVAVNNRVVYSRPKRGGRAPHLADVMNPVDDALQAALRASGLPTWTTCSMERIG